MLGLTNGQRAIRTGALGSCLIMVGAFLPWADIATVFGSISMNGMVGGGDGRVTLTAGIFALAIWFWHYRQPHIILPLLTSSIGFGVALIIGWEMYSLETHFADAPEGVVIASIGIGLYLSLLGGLMLMFAGLWACRTEEWRAHTKR